MEFVDLKTQYRLLKGPINQRIQAVLEHGRFVLGPEVVELEAKLAEFVGVKHCIAVSSGTDALLIALMAYGVGEDDEVITSPFSFFATAEVIALLGAKPVFVDIDRQTYNLDPAQLASRVTDRTKAIMPVSLYGQCADLDPINEIAAEHGVVVIEDAAQSFGATYKGRRSCGLSTCGATSFFPSKPLGCYGEGGALFVQDDAEAVAMREIRAHGEESRYQHRRLGLNARMDSLQAAVVLAKLDIFEQEVATRQRIGALYTELINNEFESVDPELSAVPQLVSDDYRSVFAQYTVSVPDRDEVAARMSKEDIPTAVHYPVPIYRQPVFEYLDENPEHYPKAEDAARKVLSLPMHPYLTRQQQAEVISALKRAVVS
ncbi:MAG: DegT/DnrJ/EryC1/StrS family aminotransferase [Gammaproteobacteria bacterium]